MGEITSEKRSNPMLSPYEELEYLSDHLPDEGETVMVTREYGELVCKQWQRANLRDGIHEPELYGLLVRSNEQLANAGTLPIWLTSIAVVWTGIVLHGLAGFGWGHWYIVPGLALPALYGCFRWIRFRQHRLFQQQVWPRLCRELYLRRVDVHALLAGVRQHGEFRTLLDELIQRETDSGSTVSLDL